MKKLTFEIRSPAHQQNAIHAVQQILPDPTKPIVVTIQERNRSLDQNRKLWACLGDVSRQVEWHGRWLDAESWKCVFIRATVSALLPRLSDRKVRGIFTGLARQPFPDGALKMLRRQLDSMVGEQNGAH